MAFSTLKSYYKYLVYSIVIIPNLIVILFGMESFPYTCAPMFAHYIDENTPLYIQRFEGYKDGKAVDLVEFYGKNPMFFNRHFHCKFYGNKEKISPYSNWFNNSDSFQKNRLEQFFNSYNSYLESHHNLALDSINFYLVQVDKHRNPLADQIPVGSFTTATNLYYSHE